MTIDTSTLRRWQANPQIFVDEVLVYYDEVTGARGSLLPAEREFLKHAFKTDTNGRLLYPEQVYGAPKKSGKTCFAALHMLTTLLLFGGRNGEGYCLANDEEQAASRVFAAIRKIIEASPLLCNEAKMTADKIVFPAFFNATINTLSSNYGTAAGANPVVSCFDELWAYSTLRSARLFDEMVPPPTRKIACRLTVTYAGFEGESKLLENLYRRGLQLPSVGKDLYAGDGLLMFWSHEPIAPWQHQDWLAQARRTLPPNQYLRMIENRFVTSESCFIDMSAWDKCINQHLGFAPADNGLAIYVGVDVGFKYDQTAIVAVTYDQAAKQVRLVFHRVSQPSPLDPLDFESTIERTLIELRDRFAVCKVLFDPWQMQATAQRLRNHGLPIEEFPQSPANLTAASQNLFELIQSQNLMVYADDAMRLAVSRAIAKETSRGWRISKETQSHKVDVVVALAMACHAAVGGKAEDFYDYSMRWVDGVGLTGGTTAAADQQNPAVPMLHSFAQGMIARANYGGFTDRRLNGSLYGPDPRLNGTLYGPSRSLFRRGW